MKQCLLDTVTLVRHFSGKGYIGAKASAILNADSQADNQFCISVITLMEVMYLAERNRIEINFQESLRRCTRLRHAFLIKRSSAIKTVFRMTLCSS